MDKDEDGVTMKQCEIAGRPAAFWMKKRRRKQPDLVARHFLFVSPVIRSPSRPRVVGTGQENTKLCHITATTFHVNFCPIRPLAFHLSLVF